MSFKVIIRLFIGAVFACALAAHSVAQSEYEAPYHDYKAAYNADGKYSIIYDNITAFAKLKEFRLKFYDSNGHLLRETETETYPATVIADTYSLPAPVMGFNVIELSIISLHDGDKRDFPTNIKGVLGLTLKEVKKAPDQPVRTLTAIEKARLDGSTIKIDAILKTLNSKSLPFNVIADDRLGNIDRISQVLSQTKDLSEKVTNDDPQGLKPQIGKLYGTLRAAKNDAENNTDIADKQSEIETLKVRLTDLRNQMAELLQSNDVEGADISNIMQRLEGIETQSGEIEGRILAIELPDHLRASDIENWEATYTALNTQYSNPPPPPFNWPLFLGALIAALALMAIVAKFLLFPKPRPRPLKSILHPAESSGVIFPASPMLAGNVAAPLAPAGQLAAAQLQMLSGPYAGLKPAYQATGRIGYAQEGVPSSEDYAFGTGFLVSDRHVVTNRHVHGLYGHYMMDKSDPGGIEFIAEKGKDSSDFVPFNCEPPLLLPSLDIAIYTLVRPVTNRPPIQLLPIETEHLLERGVVVIGYPDTHTPEAEDIKAVVEEDAVFAVKRISQGHIFRHSTDTDSPFGVETRVSEGKDTSFSMPAICHNASTLSGNSGSPLLDVQTGQLVGVHFAGFKAFNKEEAANLAMAIAQLTDETAKNINLA